MATARWLSRRKIRRGDTLVTRDWRHFALDRAGLVRLGPRAKGNDDARPIELTELGRRCSVKMLPQP